MNEEQWKRFDSIEGWLTRGEAELLLKYCKSPWLEIGTWKGKSTYVLSQTGAGTTVDWFIGSAESAQESYKLPSQEEVELNLKGTEVTIIRKDSRMYTSSQRINFLFIDGDHTYCGVRTDYDKFSPLLYKEGYLALHDVKVRNINPYPGVETLYQQLLTEGWRLVEQEFRLVILQRIE